MLFLDVVNVEDPDGSLSFRRVREPNSAELAQLTRTTAERIGRYLERHGLLERDAENGYLVDDACRGNGLLTLDLARAVGPEGRIIGVEPSENMRAEAEERCAGLPTVFLRGGTAETLSVATGEADKAVSVQVFEYIADIPAALSEARRVLRRGGRLVVGDMHFGTLVWASDDPGRMARMIAAWDRHVAWTDLPAALPALMRQADFEIHAVTPLTTCDAMLRPDGLARMMLTLMRGYAVENGHVLVECFPSSRPAAQIVIPLREDDRSEAEAPVQRADRRDLREADASSVAETARKHAVTEQTIYR